MLDHTLVRQNTIFGDSVVTGNLAVNGGSVTTTQVTASLFNTTVTTLNIGGAATATNIGASGGLLTSLSNITISNTAPTFKMTDTTASAKSLTLMVDANVASFYESAGAAGDILSLDLTNNRVGVGTTTPLSKLDVNGTIRFQAALGIGSLPTSNPLTVDLSVSVGAGSYNNAVYVAATFTQMAAATEVWGVHSVPSVSGAHTLQTLGAIYADGASMGKGTATVTNAYGLYANAPTVGSNNWSIYSASGTNYFGGNVGIGTMAPGGKLAIAADSNNLAFANAAGTNKWWEYLSGNDLRFWDTTDRVTFQSGGNVGIGTTGPNDKLQIYGGASNTALTISTDANLTSGIYLSENSIAGSASAIGGSLTYDGANNKLYLQTGTTLTPRLTIERDTGNVIIGATAAGATAAKTLALTNSATDPTTSADLAHLYAKDISAGNAALAIYAETAAIVAAAIASTHKIPIYYNNAVFYLLASDV